MNGGAFGRKRLVRTGILLDLVLVVAGTVMVFWPTLQSGFSRMQTDPGDTWFLNYVLEHETRAITQPSAAGTFWSPPFFYPTRNALTYSESLVGALPVYVLLRAAFPPDTAYQAWCIAMLVSCYAAMAFALRRLAVSPALSSLGAFIFAFGLQRASHLGHGQLLPAAFAPLAILALVQLTMEPSRRWLAGFLAASFLQVTAGIYLGWLLLLGAAAFGLLALLLDADLRARQLRFLKDNVSFVLPAFLSWAALLYLFLRPYLLAARELPPRPWSDILLLAPRPRSWIAAPTGSLWAKLGEVFPPDTPLVWEQRLFLGVVPCLLVLFGLVLALRLRNEGEFRRTVVLAALGSVLVLGLVSLRLPVKMLEVSVKGRPLEYVTLWRIVYDLVPGATSIRAVGRIWTVLLPLSLVGGLVALDHALVRLRSARWRSGLITVLVVLGVVDQFQAGLPSFDKLECRREVQSLRPVLAETGCDAGYVRLDPSKPFFVSQLGAMWGGLEANVPVLNGYSGNFPPGYPDVTRSMTDTEATEWFSHAPPGRLCIVEPATPGNPRRARVVGTSRE